MIKKNKEKVSNVLNNILVKNFNESIHCNYYCDDDDLVNEEDAYAVNIYRRILDIFLFLLSREECSDFEMNYIKTDTIAVSNDLLYYYITEDAVYSDLFEDQLNRFGWEIPEGWNVEYDVNSYDRPFYNYDNLGSYMLGYFGEDASKEYEKGLQNGYSAEYYEELFYQYSDGTIPFTLKNEKVDKAFKLYKSTKNKYCKEDFQSLYRCIDELLHKMIVHPHAEYITYTCDAIGSIYFTISLLDVIDFNFQQVFVDLKKYFNPALLEILPVLDKKITAFIKKWAGNTHNGTQGSEQNGKGNNDKSA